MKDKIEVGEYVRTKKGIAKVTNIDDLDNVAWTDKKYIYFGVTRESGHLDWHIYDDGTVLKEPSFNIIDLIEVGDIVILEDEFGEHFCCMYDESFIEAVKEDIKQGIKLKYILTNEQFKDNRYEV